MEEVDRSRSCYDPTYPSKRLTCHIQISGEDHEDENEEDEDDDDKGHIPSSNPRTRSHWQQ